MRLAPFRRGIGIGVPPVFSVVCNNISTPEIIYKCVSGFHSENDDGSTRLENGRLALFRNYDDFGNSIHAVEPDRDTLEIGFPRDEGYRVELPDTRRDADFGPGHVLQLTPDLVSPSITKNQGMIGEGVDLTIEHLKDMRPSSLVYELASHLLMFKYRDPGRRSEDEPVRPATPHHPAMARWRQADVLW